MDIKQIPGQTSQQQIESGKAQQAPGAPTTVQPKQNQSVITPSEDRVELSGIAEKLKATLATLDSVAEVNHEKITSLKNAIDSGNYQIDSAAISENLINFEQSLSE